MSVYRIRIHADRGGDPIAVDLALPSGPTVGELLPAILALVDDASTPDTMNHGWRLDRPSGGTLMDSLSLADNAVHDGELLILTQEQAPPLGLINLEPCREVAATALPFRGVDVSLPGVVCMVAALLAGATLAWSGVATDAPGNLFVAATGACVAAATARTTGHATALGMAAVTLAAVTGFLTVPSGPAAPNVFLGAAAAFAAALLVLRLSARESATLIGAATLSALIAIGTVVTIPVPVIGTVLSVTSLGLLALAPRIAIVATGLGPERWTDDMGVRAVAGHATLTGLVAGCAAGAAFGTALLAFAGPRTGGSTEGTIAFSAVVATVLLLRARTYAEPPRQTSLVVGGLLSGSTAFATAVASYPGHACWAGGALIAVALTAGRRPGVPPAVSRMVDRLEYVALAAVLPTALWVGGAYAFVGWAQPSS